MNNFFNTASVTLHFTAPAEYAIAPFFENFVLHFVASAAAHEVAAVDADARYVAYPAVGALDAQFGIALAEIGGEV